MKHTSLLILTSLIVLLGSTHTVADLNGELKKILQDKALRSGRVGVEIIRLGGSTGSRTIFQHNASTPLIPASNMKLLTTAAALELLGRDFRFRTVLARRGEDLAIIGDGDPTCGDAEMLRRVGWSVDTVYTSWADALKKRNVTAVGNIYVDDSVFDQIFVHPSWPLEQQHKRYVAQVGGVNLNVNCVDFFLRTGPFGAVVSYSTEPQTRYISVTNSCTFGQKNAVWLSRELGRNTVVLRGETNASNKVPVSVTVHDPPLYAATVLAETCRGRGIDVRGEASRDRSIRSRVLDSSGPANQRWIPVAIHETPISTVLARANKDSVNLYAEALIKRIGHTASGGEGSWANGSAAIGAFLQSLGVDASEFTIDDGSGLSKKNAISANAIAKVLAHAFNGPVREAFLDSLSVAGTDGTLERRFRDSDLRERVFAKSGYVSGVSALSGYVRTKDDNWYAFSILMNGVSDIGTARALQERIVAAIDANSK